MHLQVHKIVSDFSQACLATISKRGLVYERGGSAARYFCLSRSSSGVIAFFLISYFFPSLLLVDSFYITKITILLFDHYIPFYTNFFFTFFPNTFPFLKLTATAWVQVRRECLAFVCLSNGHSLSFTVAKGVRIRDVNIPHVDYMPAQPLFINLSTREEWAKRGR